jgi:energy-converting hydrogenase Eha subunit B
MADTIQNGRTMIERRKYQRNDLRAFVQYTSSSDTSDTALRGTIKNYSYSGICLIVSQPLAQGQEIILKSTGVPSSKKATVRWQENIGKDVYEVGLEYIRYLLDPGLQSQGTPIDNNSILARSIRFIFGIAIGGLLITVLVWISAQLGYNIPLVAVGLFLLLVGISFAVWGDKFFKVLKNF